MPNEIKKPANEIIMLLVLRPSKTESGRFVAAKVVTRLEVAQLGFVGAVEAWIADSI